VLTWRSVPSVDYRLTVSGERLDTALKTLAACGKEQTNINGSGGKCNV